jgi:hypothetical protein
LFVRGGVAELGLWTFSCDAHATWQVRDLVVCSKIFEPRKAGAQQARLVRVIFLHILSERFACSRIVSFVGVVVKAGDIMEGLCHDINIPSIQEIAMQSISCGVTTSEDERLNAIAMGEIIDSEEDFEEEEGKANRVGGRTVSVVG